MVANQPFEIKSILDGLGQGVLIFGNDGRLILENLAARSMLGNDLTIIRNHGWDAASTLFNTRLTNPDDMIESARDRAFKSERPVRFNIYRSGEVVPCWAFALQANDGEMCTMITLDTPDWSLMTSLLDQFRQEIREAISSTEGHVDLIVQSIASSDPEDDAVLLGKRISGFSKLIGIHMERVGRFMDMLERMETLRTGKLRDQVRNRATKIDLTDYFEDFIEELDEIKLVDPETDAHDHRSRIKLHIDDGLNIRGVRKLLTGVLQDILRNAIMYSMKATPIKITVTAKGRYVQIDLVDEGYGIREREHERVFLPFQRARQPQIIAEFGYGLSLYLCKNEVEAMNGRLWFESEENLGTTFSVMLPLWVNEAALESSSQTSTT